MASSNKKEVKKLKKEFIDLIQAESFVPLQVVVVVVVGSPQAPEDDSQQR